MAEKLVNNVHKKFKMLGFFCLFVFCFFITGHSEDKNIEYIFASNKFQQIKNKTKQKT